MTPQGKQGSSCRDNSRAKIYFSPASCNKTAQSLRLAHSFLAGEDTANIFGIAQKQSLKPDMKTGAEPNTSTRMIRYSCIASRTRLLTATEARRNIYGATPRFAPVLSRHMPAEEQLACDRSMHVRPGWSPRFSRAPATCEYHYSATMMMPWGCDHVPAGCRYLFPSPHAKAWPPTGVARAPLSRPPLQGAPAPSSPIGGVTGDKIVKTHKRQDTASERIE